MHQRATVGAAALLVAGILAGCSSPDAASHAPKDTTPVDRGTWPAQTVESGLAKGLRLPLAAYTPTYGDQVEVNTALGTLQTRCMAEYGFTVDLPSSAVTPPPTNDTNIERRYGITDRAQARKYGYLLPPEQRETTQETDLDLPAVQVEVLTGHTKPAQAAAPEGGDGSYVGATGATEPARAEVNGKKLRSGGCIGWSKRQLKTDDFDTGLITQLASKSLSDSWPAEPVENAVKEWSACMKGKGRKVPDPYRAIEQGLADVKGDDPTRNAIELALDDIDCKKQTRLVRVWFTEESTVQRRLIEENKSRLDDVKKRSDEVIEAARAVK